MKVVSRTYEAGGLPHVQLAGVKQLTCEKCGETAFNYGNLTELHAVLAKCLYNKPARLNGVEIRFLRKYLGYSQKMLAIRAELSVAHLCRVETGEKPVTKMFDAFIRLIVLTEKPNRDYDEHDKAIAKREKPVKLELKLEKKHWKPKKSIFEMPMINALELCPA